MAKPNFAPSTVIFIWGIFFLLGVKLYLGAVARRVPGLPTTGQLSFYILFPLAMVVLNTLIIVFSEKLPKPLVDRKSVV